MILMIMITEPPHDKTNKMSMHPAKIQISLGIHPDWSESSLSAWRKLGSLATHWAHSEDSDQTGRMPKLIWVFAGCTVILLVLSWWGWTLFWCTNPPVAEFNPVYNGNKGKDLKDACLYWGGDFKIDGFYYTRCKRFIKRCLIKVDLSDISKGYKNHPEGWKCSRQ